MPNLPRLLILPLMIAVFSLAGCKSAKEKAEDYYQSGLALLKQGDEDRAMVEFRNVFKYDGFHKDARKTYADVLRKEGNLAEAYSQYLRLIEQYPDTAEVRKILAEMAIDSNDWTEAERHGRAALQLAPQDPAVQAIGLALDYRAAVMADDEAGRAKIADEARALLATLPDSRVLHRIVIDRLISGPDPMAAMPEIDAALKADPKSLEFQMTKFRLLAKSGDVQGTGDQLKLMVDLFPDVAQVKGALIGWFMSQKDYDGAEAFLRKQAGDPTGPTVDHLALIQFLKTSRGPDAARAELQALVKANAGMPNADLYASLLAALDFEAGKKDEAIATMQAVVKAAKPSDQTRNIKDALAGMMDQTGNRVGARALVEEVLAEDPSNVAALKLRARWFIQDDKAGDAVADLRTALDQSPRDPEIATLLASAYERDGSLDLAGDQLAKAVEMSGSAPAESLRYAAFLMRQGKGGKVVEAVLTNARQVSPNNPEILRVLAEYYIKDSQWTRAQEIVDALAALNLPERQTRQRELAAAILLGQNRLDESLALLQAQVAGGDQSSSAVMTIVQAEVRSGKTAEARAYLDELLAKSPQSHDLRMISASLDAMIGQTDRAVATYRALIAENPADEQPVKMLYELLAGAGKTEDAAAVLDAGIAAQPKSFNLRWAKAVALEAAGRIDDAIAIYEQLYAEDSSNTVVANNLASLIASWRDDDASLARAEIIARRLRGLQVPGYQDTFGWIAFRRGNMDEALSHLEPAARGLPGDALTQFHLGMLYDKLGRSADAARQLELALALADRAGIRDKLPQMKLAQEALARLNGSAP